MKNNGFFVIAVLLALTLPACAGMISRYSGSGESGSVLNSGFANGVYEGAAWGYRGIIHVRVCIEEGTISEIEIIDSGEDRFSGAAAIDELYELALIYNTADLDAISGATESSEGFLAALQEALDKAR